MWVTITNRNECREIKIYMELCIVLHMKNIENDSFWSIKPNSIKIRRSFIIYYDDWES